MSISVMREQNPVSLNVIFYNNKPFISSIELFDYILPNSRKYYKRWVECNITNQPQSLPKIGYDYIKSEYFKGNNKEIRVRGRKRENLLLSISFARELCYQTKTFPANDVREFLRSLSY